MIGVRPRRTVTTGGLLPDERRPGPAAERHRLIVLASGSPRRAQLLREHGIQFRVVRPRDPEPVFAGGDAAGYARATALLKAREVARRVTEPVLAADTAVVVGDRVFGKPAGPEEARAMLRALSGRTHTVVTGVAAIDPASGRERVGHDATRLTLRHLDDAEIDWYLATGEPMDKAGAYALQGEAARFVSRIDGDRETVIGLPVRIAMGLIADLDSGRE